MESGGQYTILICYTCVWFNTDIKKKCVVITCPSSCVLWENILDWSVGPSSAEDVWATFPLLGWDATEKTPAVEAPAGTHGLHWPPKDQHITKQFQDVARQNQRLVSPSAGNIFLLCIPANHPAENRRVSYHPEACLGDGCAENLGSQCRCPEPQTEPSAPPGERAPPLCGSTAADAPEQFT